MREDQWIHRTSSTEVGLRGGLRAASAGLGLVAVLVTGCGGGDSDSGSTAAAAAKATASPTATQQEAVPAVVKVSIGDNFYKPKNLTIVRGQSISWRNQGTVAHTVTSKSGSSVEFDSGSLSPGAA